MSVVHSTSRDSGRTLGRRLALRTIVITSCLLFTACAAQSTAARGSQRNILTTEDLARAGDVSLYEAIQMLRPTYLQVRPASMAGTEQAAPVQVFVGSLQMESVEHLHEIMARNVKEVRYLEPREANAKFGGNHGTPALVVTLLE